MSKIKQDNPDSNNAIRRMHSASMGECRVVDVVRREAQREDEMLKYASARNCLFSEIAEYGFEKTAAERAAY